MATIQTSIQLNDGMSPALRAMNRAMNILLNTFEATQLASGRAIDTNAIQTARNELAQASVHMDGFENNARAAASAQKQLTAATTTLDTEINSAASAENKLDSSLKRATVSANQQLRPISRVDTEINQNTAAQNRFNNSVKQGVTASGGLLDKIKGIAAAYIGFRAVTGTLNLADTMTQTTARLNMMNDGLQTTAELEDKIYNAAMRSRGSFIDMADSVAKLGNRVGNVFKSNDETIAFAETLNKMFVVAGAGQAEISSATLQLTQALGAGVLRGEEFNAIFEASPNIIQAVADYMEQPLGKMKELASEGKISADIVKNALFAASAKVNEQFNSMPLTWGQAWTKIKNYALKATRPILNVISNITKSERFQRFVAGVTKAISWVSNAFMNVWNIVGPVLGWIFDLVGNIADLITNNWSLIAPIVWGLVAAFVAYKAVVLACAIVSGVKAAITAVMAFNDALAAAKLALLTGATFAQTAAQHGLNAALAACPITWIVLAVIALIVVFYLAVAAVNKFAGTSISATGLVAGAFGVLWATVYNVFAYMWNVVSAFVEFFANVFEHPTYSAKKLFVNLGLAMVGIMKASAGAIDQVANAIVDAVEWAVNKCIGAVNKLISKLPSKAKEFLGIKKIGKVDMGEVNFTSTVSGWEEKLNNMVGPEPEGYKSMKKLEYKDVGEEAKAWYEKGKKIDESLGLSFDQLKDMVTGNTNLLGEAVGKQLEENPALGKIADNTGKTAENTGKSKEELDWMKQLAEREAINRFTLRDVSVKMTNNNQIRNGVDADEVMQKIARQIFQEADASAAGAHY